MAMTVPVAIVFFVFQKYIMRTGKGAVKELRPPMSALRRAGGADRKGFVVSFAEIVSEDEWLAARKGCWHGKRS
jgi:hypothetical protein